MHVFICRAQIQPAYKDPLPIFERHVIAARLQRAPLAGAARLPLLQEEGRRVRLHEGERHRERETET